MFSNSRPTNSILIATNGYLGPQAIKVRDDIDCDQDIK